MKTEQLTELTSGKLNPPTTMHNRTQQMEKKVFVKEVGISIKLHGSNTSKTGTQGIRIRSAASEREFVVLWREKF